MSNISIALLNSFSQMLNFIRLFPELSKCSISSVFVHSLNKKFHPPKVVFKSLSQIGNLSRVFLNNFTQFCRVLHFFIIVEIRKSIL